MANPVSSVDVPLSIFSGWNTELSPPDQPEGASPANSDVAYSPGAVSTRPGLNRVFSVPVDSLGPFSYEKSFVLPSGNKQNLYLTMQDGKLWVEDVTNTPGTATLLYASAGATYASSCTAQGFEYIALSDGKHGVDVPLLYDGTQLWRITQDAPGNAPAVSNLLLPAVEMAASGNTLTRMSNQVLCQTATAHNLKVGYQAQISNVPDSNASTVNQTQTSTSQPYNHSVWDFNSGQYRSLFNPGTSSLSDFQALGYGLTIPSAATILGVIVSFGVIPQASTTGTVDQVGLWYSGALDGTAKMPGTLITPGGAIVSYGGAADLWGAALTPAVVNDPSFGFAVSCTCDSIRVFLYFPFTVQVYYTLSGSGTVAEIDSIVIDNEVNPGLALVTTAEPHGLIPQIQVSIVGVEPAAVANVSQAQWVAGLTTLTTDSDHNLAPGTLIQVANVTTSTGSTTFSFNGTFLVQGVPSPNQLTYVQVPITATDPDVIDGTAATGSITLSWPLPSYTPVPNYFTVQSCPTPTTFYIPIEYSNGTWTTGSVGFIWEGIFFVTTVPTSTSFTYYQPGPNGATTAVGTVTPFGQCAPGLHYCQIAFLNQRGTITGLSPATSFIANGGQYVFVDDLLTGPAGTSARIILFSGAQANFPNITPPMFYIPVPANIGGFIVSTATQINDNTTTSVTLDFSDNTLYAATAVSIPGNNLANMEVLGPSAGMFTYGGRLLAWGNRNKVGNLLNMGFDGGPSAGSPPGWERLLVDGTGNTQAGRFGNVWNIAADSGGTPKGGLTQSAYTDYLGAPILLGNQYYSLRLWLQATSSANISLIATIQSLSTSFLSTIAFTGISATGSFQEGAFAQMPATIPSDMTFSIWAENTNGSGSVAVLVDDLELFYTNQPYIPNEAWISYEENLGAFDNITGFIGPADDQSPIMNFGTIRQTLYIVTGTGLHETQDNGQTEPSGWNVDQVADNCGAYSIAAVARNAQGIGSAGKDWMMWSGPDGAQHFDGQTPKKVSQELQSVWDAIPSANAYQCWVKNYENAKLCFFGIPSASSMRVLVLDYRNIDGQAIPENPPIHISFTGKMIVSDLTRKWSPWSIPAWCGELMYRGTAAQPQIVFGCLTPDGAANSYILNPSQYLDDDFGVIPASYTTYFFVSHEMEQALQVGSHRKVYTMAAAYITGIGDGWTITPLAASLTNAFPISSVYPFSDGFDMDFGINVETTRCAFTFQASPDGAGNAYFKLQKMVINMAPAPWAKVRGTSGGTF